MVVETTLLCMSAFEWTLTNDLPNPDNSKAVFDWVLCALGILA